MGPRDRAPGQRTAFMRWDPAGRREVEMGRALSPARASRRAKRLADSLLQPALRPGASPGLETYRPDGADPGAFVK